MSSGSSLTRIRHVKTYPRSPLATTSQMGPQASCIWNAGSTSTVTSRHVGAVGLHVAGWGIGEPGYRLNSCSQAADVVGPSSRRDRAVKVTRLSSVLIRSSHGELISVSTVGGQGWLAGY